MQGLVAEGEEIISAQGHSENLNEHVLGDRWPLPDERLEMLEEAVDVMRLLWKGGEQTHRGRHYVATPSDFEEAAAMVDEEDVAEATPHGPDPAPYLDQIREYADAGFTHVYMHQIGDNQDEFADFARRELMPELA
jgi:hypothetical protein